MTLSVCNGLERRPNAFQMIVARTLKVTFVQSGQGYLFIYGKRNPRKPYLTYSMCLDISIDDFQSLGIHCDGAGTEDKPICCNDRLWKDMGHRVRCIGRQHAFMRCFIHLVLSNNGSLLFFRKFFNGALKFSDCLPSEKLKHPLGTSGNTGSYWYCRASDVERRLVTN